ncbi:MAG: autotransporter-associated beta strand repeat containing protein, partial [Solidesulfovibrio magneticus str. Maddingley MBC34]
MLLAVAPARADDLLVTKYSSVAPGLTGTLPYALAQPTSSSNTIYFGLPVLGGTTITLDDPLYIDCAVSLRNVINHTVTINQTSRYDALYVSTSDPFSIGGDYPIDISLTYGDAIVAGIVANYSTSLNIGSFGKNVTLTTTATTGNAYGLLTYYDNNSGDITISSGLSGTISASAASGSAWGLKSGMSGDYAYKSIAISGGLSGTVTAVAAGSGLARGMQGQNITIDTLSGTVAATTTGSGYAYALEAFNGNTSGTLTIGTLSGEVTATSAGGQAFGLYGYSAISITGDLTKEGSVSATGSALAYGLYTASYDIAITGKLAGTVTASAASAYGFGAGGNITIAGGLTSDGSVTATGVTSAWGMNAAYGSLTIQKGLAGSVASEATSSSSGAVAYGLSAAYGALNITGGLSGTITATAKYGDAGKAYALYTSSGAISIDTVTSTGKIEATAGDGGYAYAIYAASGTISVTGDMAGEIKASATSTNSTAFASGIAAEAGSITISGGLSRKVSATVTAATFGSGYAYGLMSKTGITIDAVASTGSVEATISSAGFSGSAYGLYASSGTISITNDLAGSVAATATASTVGIGVAYGLSASDDISLGSLSGTVTATGGATAYGLQSSGANISITGALSGTVTAKTTNEDLGTAYGLYAGGNINGGDTSTALVVSGTIDARAFGPAYAVYAAGSVNLSVTGSLIGYDTLDANGYAIYAGSSGSSVTLDLAAAASTSLVGKVHLTGGTLTLLGTTLGTNSADNLFEGVTSLVVGDETHTISWTLNPAYANRSSFEDLTIKANAALSINEYVSITSFIAIADEGTLTWDTANGDKDVSTAISGSGTLTKTGIHTLTLSGAYNSLTGATIVSAGTLKAGAAGAFSSGSAVSVATDATLALNSHNQTIAGLSGDGSVTLGSATLTVNTASGVTSTFSGILSGTGGLTKSGNGTLALSGANAYTGATTVSAGTLTVTSTGSLDTNSITVASGATLDFSGSPTSLTNLTSLTNSGTINLTSALTFSDADCTIISTGSILAASATDIAIQLGAGNDRVTLGPGATVRGIIDGGDGTNTLSLVGSVSLDGKVRHFQNLIKQDAGSWTITGDVALTESLTVSAGNLTLEGGLTATSVSIASGASLTWANASAAAYSGVISGDGSLIKSGAGALTLSGANTSTGAT